MKSGDAGLKPQRYESKAEEAGLKPGRYKGRKAKRDALKRRPYTVLQSKRGPSAPVEMTEKSNSRSLAALGMTSGGCGDAGEDGDVKRPLHSAISESGRRQEDAG